MSSSLQVNSSIQVSSSDLPTYDLQLRKAISPSSELRFGCSWTPLESPLSQEYIHMLEENIRCLTEVIDELVTSGQLVNPGQLVRFAYV